MKRFLTVMHYTVLMLLMAISASAQIASSRIAGGISSTVCPGSGCLAFPVSGFGGVGIQVAGTFTGTISFEGTVDDATWVAINMTPPNSTTAVTTATAVGAWTGPAGGLSQVRARFSAYTSGTANITMVSAATTARGSGGGGAAVTIGDTQVAYATAADTLGGDPDFVWDDAARQLKLVAEANSTATIQANAAGAQMHIYAGDGSNTASQETGGEVVILSGDGSPNGNGNGGAFTIESGGGSSGASSGAVLVKSGNADGASGGFALRTGDSATGNSGTILIQAGMAPMGTGGDVGIEAGGFAYLAVGSYGFTVESTGNSITGPIKANLTIGNGLALTTTETTAHTALLQAYDNDTGPAYVTFATFTNGNTPSLVIAPPAGGATVSVTSRYISSGAVPAVADTSANSCGTGTETIVGNDNASKVTVIGSAGTSCTVTFAAAFANAPSCFVTNETTANLARATSTASTVIVAGTFLENDVLAVGCIGR